jgi:myo-inositol-1(or 4)-monophosphatase
MNSFLAVAERAARAAGAILLDWRGKINPREKGRNDLVTEADFAAQRAIAEMLLGEYPHHQFLGEETLEGKLPGSEPAHSPFRWIVDPLDGTANYVHQLPMFAVSIALDRNGELILGVIYDPVSDECFTAALGEGVRLNGKRLQTSGCARLERAMVAVSFSNDVDRNSPEIARFVEALVACRSVRRLGSAALNLAYIAAGRLDAYWASCVKAWDIAAGGLMVREAGGMVTNLAGGPLDLSKADFVAAATPALHAATTELLRRAETR